jgi:hypothetical protein
MKNRKEVIIKALLNLEFICGLKQIREYSKEDLNRLVDGLERFVGTFNWLNNQRLETILSKGMRGEYGQFYHINEMTVSGWIKGYFESNKQQIIKEIAYVKDEIEPTEEEKLYWINLGKERFKELFNYAKKTGIIPGLSLKDFPVYWYDKMVNKDVLKPEKYTVDREKAKKDLRLANEDYSELSIEAKVKDLVWREFIKDCIDNEIDLAKMI